MSATRSETEPAATTTTRRRRGAISRDDVLAAALDLIDRDGLDALSMRRLADRLDMEPMSLYKRVANKDDLLAGIAEMIWAEVADAAQPFDVWTDWLRTLGNAIRAALRDHPNAVPLLISTRVFPVPMLEVIATQLERTSPGWPDRSAAAAAIDTVAAFALGCSMADCSYCSQATSDRQRLSRIARALPADTPDRLIDTALDVCGYDTDEMFANGLHLILRGCQPAQPETKR